MEIGVGAHSVFGWGWRGCFMTRLLVEDALGEMVEPLPPPPKLRRRDHPGRKPLDNRRALTGILFVLKTGIAWRDLPSEMGCGCGVWLADAGCITGMNWACGNACRNRSWPRCATPTRLT